MEEAMRAAWSRMWERCWGRMTTTTTPMMHMKTRTRRMFRKSWRVGYVVSSGDAEDQRGHEDVKLSSAWNRG